MALVATIGVSWAPFDFSAADVARRIDFALRPLRTPAQVLDLLPHLLVFTGLGILAALSARSGARSPRLVLALAVLAAAIETGQLFLPVRHPEVFDLIAHLSGALLGVLVGRRFLTAKRRRSSRPRSRGLHLGIAWFSGIAGFLTIIVPLLGCSWLTDWDRNFPLVVGNEADGQRPWLGEIRYLCLYRQALGESDALRCFRTVQDSDPSRYREPMGLLAAYRFTSREGDKFVPDPGSRLPLSLGPARADLLGRDGLILKRPSLISTEGAAEALTSSISESGRFSVEVWFRPSDLKQNGPARIVTLSTDPWHRNFTLGQERKRLVFRVRNRISGQNGTRYQLETGGILRPGLRHVVVAYDRGVSALFLDGRRAGPVRDLRTTPSLLGLGQRMPGELVVMFLWVFPFLVSFRALDGRRYLLRILPLLIPLALPLLLSDPVNAQATRAARLGCFGAACLLSVLLVDKFCANPARR